MASRAEKRSARMNRLGPSLRSPSSAIIER